MSLRDDEPLTRQEARIVATSATSRHAKEWWAGLPDTMRSAIIRKTAKAFLEATTPRDIGTLSRALIAMDRLDLERERLAAGVTATTTINGPVQINNGPAELFRELLAQVKANAATGHTPQAPAESAGDD